MANHTGIPVVDVVILWNCLVETSFGLNSHDGEIYWQENVYIYCPLRS